MAARRITKSAIDWVAFAERIPESQKPFFLAFKAKSDTYVRKAFSLPETAPKLDFAYYRTRISPSTLVDQFEKQYAEVKIPYPSENVTPEIDAQEKAAVADAAVFVKESNERIKKYEKELETWKNMVPFDHMTMEDFRDTFPELAFDPLNRPTAWPHDEDDSHMVPRSAVKE